MNATIIYDVILTRHKPCSRPDVCIFYDEDKKEALNVIKEYVKQNGFTITEKDGKFSIATITLRERESTGKVLSEKKYHELFNTVTGELIA